MFRRATFIAALIGCATGCGGSKISDTDAAIDIDAEAPDGAVGPLNVPEDFAGLIIQTGYSLTWIDTNVDEEHHVIEKKNENEADFTVVAELVADTTSYIDADFVAADQPQYRWVVANHPGQRYVISYWSHGGGALSFSSGQRSLKSIGYDDTDAAELTAEETAHVTDYLATLAGRKIEVFFICACLTQMFENAYPMRGSVKYVVAGEKVIRQWWSRPWSGGWTA